MNGHLETVKWLHANRTERCTKSAMNFAAGNGHLSVVQWLHENRNEGCSIGAMCEAAANGHLSVLQFLHANRQEGCTPYAKYKSAANGHFDTFKWLYENRPELLSHDSILQNKWDREAYTGILKCQALYVNLNHDRFGWFIDNCVQFGEFEAMEILLARAHEEEVTSIDSEYVDLAAFIFDTE